MFAARPPCHAGSSTIPPPGVLSRSRKRLRLSRQKFADRFGLDVRALQEWEQGRRVPDRAARVLLTVIDRDPRGRGQGAWRGWRPAKPGVVPWPLEEHAACMAARRPGRRLNVPGDPDSDPARRIS